MNISLELELCMSFLWLFSIKLNGILKEPEDIITFAVDLVKDVKLFVCL